MWYASLFFWMVYIQFRTARETHTCDFIEKKGYLCLCMKINLILVTCEADMCDAHNQMCIYRRVIMHGALPSVESKTHTKAPTSNL